MAKVEIRNLRKAYGALDVLHGISIDIDDGEFLALVGPSGCGKSTLLRTIAGLETFSDGDILIDGRLVNDLAPKDRDIAMVFQNYALYPHMNVGANMGFALKLAGRDKPEIEARVGKAAAILDLTRQLERKPAALSGGQRQRVAMGRAIVRQPAAFLFDEPLSNLDAELRVSMRVEIARLHRELGNTMIYVTHDQTEAMTLADMIVVLRDGRIEQVGNPRRVYEDPDNAFVAGFIGSPRMNLFDAVWAGEGRVTIAGRTESVAIAGDGLTAGDRITFGLRPEHLVVGDADGLPARVDVLEYLGGTRYLYCQLGDGQPLIAEYRDGPDIRAGDTIHLGCPANRRYVFDKDDQRRH